MELTLVGFGTRPGTKLLGFYKFTNHKSKVALRNRLLEVKCLIIDEIFMVSSGLWTEIGKDWKKFL